METITIFEIPDEEVAVSKSQKELDYEQLQKDSKFPGYHFINFYELEQLAEYDIEPNSNIPSILCKYVLDWITPIIDKSDGKKESKTYSLSIQLDHPIIGHIGVIDETKQVTIPANQQFSVIGLMFPKEFIRYYDLSSTTHWDYISNREVGLSGHYSLINTNILRYAAQRQIYVNHKIGNTPYYTGLENTMHVPVMFKNDETTILLLNKYMKYISFLSIYYNNVYPSLLLNYQLAADSDKLNTKITLLNSFIENKAIENKSDIGVAKLIFPSLDFRYKSDLYNLLNASNLLVAYNIADKLGIQNKIFSEKLRQYNKEKQAKELFQQQINEGFTKQLDYAKQLAIALRKYGVKDLSQLDKKQLTVVKLEYDKMEKSNAVTKQTKDIQYLWRSLRESFDDLTDERLKLTLNKISHIFDKKDLESFKLLDGGVCPHLYAQGKSMLENFGKPWMNTELLKVLITYYSLPKDISGYFCHICGEKLAEADNDQLVRFVDGAPVQSMQMEDPLLTMIWKETTYIITTYVRFNPAQPIRPLVNSISSGLRNILATEEVKLYRNKTSTPDSIKNTLNLYANMYIYAVLCAMMIANPNKIIFAREKPTSGKTGGKKTKRLSDSDENESPYLSNTVKSSNKRNPMYSLAKKLVSPDRHVSYIRHVSPDQPGSTIKNNHKNQTTLHKQSKGGKKPDTTVVNTTSDIKLYERFVLTTALNLILITKDTTINRIQNINVDIVKQIFLKQAYTWAKQHIRPIQEQPHEKFDPRIQLIITTDTLYKYTLYAKNLDLISHGKKQLLRLTDVQQILGRPPKQVDEEIKKDINVYSTIEPPKQWHFHHNKTIGNDKNGTNLYDLYTYRSYLCELEYAKQKIYTKDFIPQSIAVKEFYESFNDVLVMERELALLSAKRYIRPLYQVKWLNNLWIYNDFSPSKIDLAQHYCPSGERHKIGSRIYSNSKETEELTKDQIKDWLIANDTAALKRFATMYIADIRCMKCKKLIWESHANDKFDKALKATFLRMNNIQAFYQYYDSRCPKGELHDIQDFKCAKCGLHTDFKVKADTEYYEKYADLFDHINQRKLDISVEKLSELQEINSEAAEYHVAKSGVSFQSAVNYSFTLQQLAEWSKISDVKYNILLNTGLTEGYKFKEISDNVANPTKLIEHSIRDMKDMKDTKNDELIDKAANKYSSFVSYTTYDPKQSQEEFYISQAMKLRSYILEVIRTYNTTINHDTTSHIPLEIKDILINSKKSGLSIDTKTLRDVMPNIVNDFISLDGKYKFSLSDKDYANFLLEFLAGMMVKLVKDTPVKYKKFGEDLMKYFTSRIVNTEQLYSKPESLYAKMTKIVEVDDDNVSGTDSEVDLMYKSDTESATDDEVIKDDDIVQDIDNEAFDVENVADVYELE